MTVLHDDLLGLVRAVVGLAVVAFVPGWLWTLVIWDDLHLPTRVFYAIVLSLSTVMLVVWTLNAVWAVPISLGTSVVAVLFVSAIPAGILARPHLEDAWSAWTREPGDGPDL